MKQYYIHTGKEQLGPFTQEQLQERGITRNTLIWYDGLDDWTEASKLFDFPALPPELKKTPPPLTKKDSDDSEQKIVISKRGVAIVIIAILAVLVYINRPLSWHSDYQPSYYVPTQTDKENFKKTMNEVVKDENKEHQRRNINKYIHVYTNDFKKDILFGGIWDLIITVQNNSDYFIDMVGVNVHYYKGDGKTYKLEQMVFNNIEAGKSILLNAPRSDKGVSVKCFIKVIRSDELGVLNKF